MHGEYGLPQEQRAARNEALFRDSNEQIQALVEKYGVAKCDFLCECSNAGCGAQVTMTLADYEEVRAHGTRFVIALGHEDTAIERVVAQGERHSVVEKIGAGAAIAHQLNPRRNSR